MSAVSVTTSPDAAAWQAELTAGDGPGRIYTVEPTGALLDETDPAGGTYPVAADWYRSTGPLRVTGEYTDRDGRPLRFYHGTKAALRTGDLVETGRAPNFGERERATYVYLTGTLDAAAWGAELAEGEGRGRIYQVEPTGPIEDDPDLTDRKFPGNPTKSYRSREPLLVVGEVEEWQGHAPETLEAMKQGLERLEREGVGPIDD